MGCFPGLPLGPLGSVSLGPSGSQTLLPSQFSNASVLSLGELSVPRKTAVDGRPGLVGGREVISRLSVSRGADSWENTDLCTAAPPSAEPTSPGRYNRGFGSGQQIGPSSQFFPGGTPCTRPVAQFLQLTRSQRGGTLGRAVAQIQPGPFLTLGLTSGCPGTVTTACQEPVCPFGPAFCAQERVCCPLTVASGSLFAVCWSPSELMEKVRPLFAYRCKYQG